MSKMSVHYIKKESTRRVGAVLAGIALLAMSVVFCPAAYAGEETESETAKDAPARVFKETVNINTIEILKPLLASPSPNYTIRETVGVDVPNYVFTVTCPHGEYELTTMHALLKTCHEIDVIETFRNTEHGPQILNGAAQSVMELGRGAKTIVFHPVAAGKALVRAPARIVRDVGRIISGPFRKREEEANGEDSTIRTKGAKGFLYSKDIRYAAYELGVDVYTDNINLQALLHSLARQRKIGKLALSFAMPSIEGLKYVKYAATGGSSKVAVEQMIMENNAYELERLNAKLYKERLNADFEQDEALANLLHNYNFSPREEAYMRATLEEIQPEAGLHEAFLLWSNAADPDQAIYFSVQMDLLGIIHNNDCHLKELISIGSDLAALNERRELNV